MKSACRVITGLVAIWALVPQVGADEPTPTTEQKAPVAVEAAAAPETAVAAEPVEAATKEDAAAHATIATADDPVICKRFEATGTRLRKGKVCRKKSEWDQQEARADDIVKGIEKGASVGVQDF